MSKGIETLITIKIDDVLPEGFYEIYSTLQRALAREGFYVQIEDIEVLVNKQAVRTIKQAIGA